MQSNVLKPTIIREFVQTVMEYAKLCEQICYNVNVKEFFLEPELYLITIIRPGPFAAKKKIYVLFVLLYCVPFKYAETFRGPIKNPRVGALYRN